MSQGTATRGNRPAPAGSTATRGVVLVVCAVVIGILLILKGGGGAESSADPNDDLRSSTTVPSGDGQTTTTAQGTTATAVPPGELKIIVANGSGIERLAARTRDALAFVGYTAATPVDTIDNQVVPTSVVYFAPGVEEDAKVVASVIGMPAARVTSLPDTTSVPVANIGDARVIVILGPDAPRAAGQTGATTTTVAQ